MDILKYEKFMDARKLVLFVNSNQIPKEKILIINTSDGGLGNEYTLFYYGDSEVKEEVPGFFD